MPFESKAQQRFMFAKHPRIARRWATEMEDRDMDFKKLPEKKDKEKFAGFLATVKKYSKKKVPILEKVAGYERLLRLRSAFTKIMAKEPWNTNRGIQVTKDLLGATRKNWRRLDAARAAGKGTLRQVSSKERMQKMLARYGEKQPWREK